MKRFRMNHCTFVLCQICFADDHGLTFSTLAYTQQTEAPAQEPHLITCALLLLLLLYIKVILFFFPFILLPETWMEWAISAKN